MNRETASIGRLPPARQNIPARIWFIAGFIPWIIFWALSPFSVCAVIVAFIFSAIFNARTYYADRKIMFLDSTALLFFVVYIIFTFLGSSIFVDHGDVIFWLMLCGMAFCSIAAGYPFTCQIAKESVPEKFWNAPIFKETNDLLTGIWGLLFLADAILCQIGSSSHNPIISTIIPIAIVIFAIACSNSFGRWYARKAYGKTYHEAKSQTGQEAK